MPPSIACTTLLCKKFRSALKISALSVSNGSIVCFRSKTDPCGSWPTWKNIHLYHSLTHHTWSLCFDLFWVISGPRHGLSPSWPEYIFSYCSHKRFNHSLSVKQSSLQQVYFTEEEDEAPWEDYEEASIGITDWGTEGALATLALTFCREPVLLVIFLPTCAVPFLGVTTAAAPCRVWMKTNLSRPSSF